MNTVQDVNILQEEPRFWSKVDMRANVDLCWEWSSAKDLDGYGLFQISGKTKRAHRLSYFLHYKVDPIKKLICHTCDNPSCVNPFHLFAGSPKDNTKDCILKNRRNTQKGEDSGGAKLSESQVREIFYLYQNKKANQEELSKMFGVSAKNISKIITGSRWKHLGIILPKETKKMISSETVLKIRELNMGGHSYEQIAEKYNLHRATVWNICTKRTWKNI